MQYQNLYMVFITRDAQAMKEKLLSGQASPITYAGEKPPEILEEDKEIASFPIPVSEDKIRIIDIDEVLEKKP